MSCICFLPNKLFRADLISAMKIPDSQSLEAGTYMTIREPWRTEWDIGVQVEIHALNRVGYMYYWLLRCSVCKRVKLELSHWWYIF